MKAADSSACLMVGTIPKHQKSDVLARLICSMTAESNRHKASAGGYHQRAALPFLMELKPLDETGQPTSGEPTVIVGREVSSQGLSFFHAHPLTCRRATVLLNHPQSGRLKMEIDLNRCLFHKIGWYESSARLVRAIELVLPTSDRSLK